MTEVSTGVVVSLISLGASNFLGLIVSMSVLNTRQEERHRENQRRLQAMEEQLENQFVRRSECAALMQGRERSNYSKHP